MKYYVKNNIVYFNLLILHLSNNGGFVIGVCFNLEETTDDCKMPRSILLDVLNKRIITGNG